jgi:threonine dehydratase/peptide deformylase
MHDPADILPILVEGDPRLAAVAAPVVFPDPSLPAVLRCLHATLADFRARAGFGRAMAAPQAGIGLRIVAMNLGATPFALINPRITRASAELIELWDDCLSVPGRVVRVRRHASVDLVYQDERGRERHWRELPPELAELVQHEIDHLDGVLMSARAHGPDAVRPMVERAVLVDAARPAHRLSLARIAEAAADIPALFRDTPQYVCEPLAAALGCRLTLKLEFLNPIRSFKARGASVLLAALAREGERGPIVGASAGNWGQALAWAGRALQLPVTIFAAHGANPHKVARMRALGADVRLAGADFDAAKDAGRAHAAAGGGRWVEDGCEPQTAEGHGTIAVELLARGDAFDAVVVPLGNGALLAGIARWFRAASPATRVIGVCARGAPSMALSLREGRACRTDVADTIADGIAVRVPVPEALDDLRGLVDDVLLVDDATIVDAMRMAFEHAGLVLEPSGAAGLAGVLVLRERLAGASVATVLCGSNVADEHRALLVGGAQAASSAG